VQVALDTGCELLHPGYGFLSERADLARACADAGVRFVGPSPAVLEVAGDKVRAREVAARRGSSVADGTGPVETAADVADFLDGLGGAAAALKATAGGGGRGTRRVAPGDDLAAALERCRAEAERAFGDPTVHLERWIEPVRHVEVQLVGTRARGGGR
jgi:pyruvate carboxylase